MKKKKKKIEEGGGAERKKAWSYFSSLKEGSPATAPSSEKLHLFVCPISKTCTHTFKTLRIAGVTHSF